MNKSLCRLLFVSFVILGSFGIALAQSSTGSISGTVSDERESVIPGATVTVRSVETGFSRTATTDREGRYKFVSLPIGAYEITIEAANFAKYVQTGIALVVNQDAVVDATLKAGTVKEVVTVTSDASVLNTTTAEVSTRFDERRLSELPIGTTRSVFGVLLSVPGVSQLSSGQTGFANGISFSANGGRLRSNNFMLDGQDINDPSVAGGQISLNNPDAIGEVRIITNQFLAEYGRNSGAVVNFVGKSGTNDYHGSGFVYHNNENLNACSNLQKASGFCNPNAANENQQKAPYRKEFQYGGTFGGPLTFPWFGDGGNPALWKGTDRTFFFGDYQRWTDRQLGSGFTLNGAPTEAGRAILQSAVGARPQVAALLQYLPAGVANGQTRSFTANGQTYVVPIGNLTNTSSIEFNSHQGSVRIDHRFSDKNLLYGRYRFDDNTNAGAGQVTPPGLTTVVPIRSKAATLVWNSVINNKLSNEVRVAWTRYSSTTTAFDPSSQAIPSIEVTDLGLTGFNAANSRTAIGLAVNLPQFRVNDTYQITDALTYITGNHAFKFGVDLRRTDAKVFFVPTTRGRLAYTTLQNFVDDVAQTATINAPLQGGDIINFYRWYEYYFFAQDEWRVTRNLTLTLGLRYEWPGDSFSYLKETNERILAQNSNNPAYAMTPVPGIDKNNLMPRIGFNWNPQTSRNGVLGFITGGDRMVVRGGYSRTYDANYINLNLNVAGSFPFLASITFPASQPGYASIRNFLQNPNFTITNPNLLTRTVVAEDFRAPSTDQYSFEIQREVTSNMVFKVGYIRTAGRGLFQTVDGNPRTACPGGNTVVTTPQTIPLLLCPRVDPTRGVIRLRANRASSTYDSLQTSLEKRLSEGFSFGLHYTYSSFIDTASETFNPSNAEVAVAQDSFNLESDRARSSFDRPHRLSGNFVYELPFFRDQRGFVGHLLGGIQVNSFFSIQSGAPFTILDGADPAGALNGIDGLVGNSIRANINTTMDISSMSIREILAACGTRVTSPTHLVNSCPNLFSRVTNTQRLGTAGRNIVRANDYFNVDFGIMKNTRITESVRVQLRADMFNVLNVRNFGVPEGRINAPNFLNQWATDGGNRRIILGARLVF